MTNGEIKAELTATEIEIVGLITKIQNRVEVYYDEHREDGIDLPTVQCVLDNVYQLRESLASARAENRALREMLKKHEWAYTNNLYGGPGSCSGYYCQTCGNLKEEGHKPDCALAALLTGDK